MRNIIKVRALKDDFSDDFFRNNLENYKSLRRNYKRTRNGVLDIGRTVNHFHVVSDNYLLQADGVIARKWRKREGTENKTLTGSC